MTKLSKPARKSVDWESVGKAYMAGVLSIREVAKIHGISDTAIRKRAAADGWTRDLSEKVAEKVRSELVRSEFAAGSAQTEKEIVETAAATVVQVVRSHRTGIARFNTLLQSLLLEIEQTSGDQSLFEQLSELVIDPTGGEEDSKASAERAFKLKQAFDKVLSIPGRVDSMKKLAETMKILVSLERQAFGMQEDDGDDNGKKMASVNVTVNNVLSPEEAYMKLING